MIESLFHFRGSYRVNVICTVTLNQPLARDELEATQFIYRNVFVINTHLILRCIC